MNRLSINNIEKLESLSSELEFEKASSLYLKLRVLVKKDDSYIPVRKHVRKLIKKYELEHWTDEENVTDEQVKESDLAEQLLQLENLFYQRRKELIKLSLKSNDLNQSDLAKLLCHSKSYMSELINGLRPFSKEDIVVMNRLFKISLEDLMPTFIKDERALHIRRTLKSLPNNKIKLTRKDFDLQSVCVCQARE
jgi:transcriptional regulator with XRE-family HTH domain